MSCSGSGQSIVAAAKGGRLLKGEDLVRRFTAIDTMADGASPATA